jgi:zinc transport system substrate-binding protein
MRNRFWPLHGGLASLVLCTAGCGGDAAPGSGLGGSGGVGAETGGASSGGSGPGGAPGAGGSPTSGGSPGTGGGAGSGGEPEGPFARLVVADEAEAKVRVLDLKDGAEVDSYDLASPARVYITESGRFAVLVQRNNENPSLQRVNFLDSGVILEEHGEHWHEELEPPSLLSFNIHGHTDGPKRPGDTTLFNGYVSLHFDGLFVAATDENPGRHVSAQNFLIHEAHLLEATAADRVLQTDRQHGFALMTHRDRILMTVPNSPPSGSVLGVTVRAASDGSVLQTFADADDPLERCIGAHGQAKVGEDYLIGCNQQDGGLLVLSWNDTASGFEVRKILYPHETDSAPTHRVSTLAWHADSAYAVGNWSPSNDRIVRVDPTASAIDEAADGYALGALSCGFGFERQEGSLVVALTRKGELHIVDVASWELQGTVSVLPDTSAEMRCGGQLALGDGFAYVTDTASGRVYEVDLNARVVSRHFTVPGKPAALGVFGWLAPLGSSH